MKSKSPTTCNFINTKHFHRYFSRALLNLKKQIFNKHFSMTASNKAWIKNKLKIIKMRNLAKAGIILETQIRNKTSFKKIFKKVLPSIFSPFTYFLYVFLLICKQCKTVLIRFWLLAFKNKRNFLLFFLNRATVVFILIFLILNF